MDEKKVVKKGRGGKYNFPSAVEPEDPETVRAALGSVLYWMNRGRLEKPTTDEEVEERCIEYMTECWQTGQRMTVEKLALALGVSRDTLNSWERGETQSARRSDIIKRTKESIAAYDADMVAAGKMNPVPYIFRAKNYYHMTDTVQVQPAPVTPITALNPADVAAKYAELPNEIVE